MRLGPLRLILFRLYNLTLGRFAVGDRLLRGTLERVTIRWRKPQKRYTASAGFFDVRDLDADWDRETRR